MGGGAIKFILNASLFVYIKINKIENKEIFIMPKWVLIDQE